MGEAPPFANQDPVTVLADVTTQSGDGPVTLHLSGRIVAQQESEMGLLIGVEVPGLPPGNRDDEGAGRVWFQGKDFINADLGRAEVFLSDMIGYVGEDY